MKSIYGDDKRDGLGWHRGSPAVRQGLGSPFDYISDQFVEWHFFCLLNHIAVLQDGGLARPIT